MGSTSSRRRHRQGGPRHLGSFGAVVVALLVALTAVPALAGVGPGSGWFGRGTGDLVAASSTGAAATGSSTTTSPTPSGEVTTPGTATPASTPTPTKTTTTTAKATAAPAGGCARKVGTKPAVRTTAIKLPHAAKGYGGEGDTEPLPMAIAATPSGTSWLAWLGTGGKVWLAKLSCADKIVGTPRSFTGVDLQDVQADSKGGVLLLTRKGPCGAGKLCGGSASPCYQMFMIRFDTAGKQVWQRQVTNLTSSRQGYSDGARFVWWYQHHGRLASDGSNYAAYFGVAITVKNGSCVDIHEGDRMQVVNAKGKLLTGHRDAFEVGCSHAWTSRIVWDPRTKHFAMACATDNDCRIAQPDPYRTIAAGTCDGTLFGGDLVLAKGSGYWTAWSQGGKVRLARFTTGRASTSITTAARSQHPHLVAYGSGRMLLTWQNGSAVAARVYNASSGKAVGAQFAVKVKDHSYQAWKAYKDGSVAYPAAGGSSSTIVVARVMPMT